MNAEQIALARRVFSLRGVDHIRDFQLETASILLRMAVVDNFTYSMALVCAGMDIERSRAERTLNELTTIMRDRNREHGSRNASVDDESLFRRYCFFVQYATKWPTGKQIRDGLHTIDHKQIKSDERAGAMMLVGYTHEQCRGGKYTMKCSRFDQKHYHIKMQEKKGFGSFSIGYRWTTRTTEEAQNLPTQLDIFSNQGSIKNRFTMFYIN